MKADWRYLVLWLSLVSGCSTFTGGPTSGAHQQDSGEAVRLKAVLLEAPDLSGSAIDVTIDQERILLDGFVETTAQRKRAEDLMRQNSDIDQVTNQIQVK